MKVPPAILWEEGQLRLLDQRLLPGKVEYLLIEDIAGAVEAIASLAVRGAPAIGIAAAYALAVAARRKVAGDDGSSGFPQRHKRAGRGPSAIADGPLPGGSEHRSVETGLQVVLQLDGDALIAARPTAVNLRWAVERMRRRGAAEATLAALIDEAETIHREDAAACRAIGEHGRGLVEPGSNVLTHCNAGALAVSELGTATAPLYLNHQAGTPFHVYVDETRPLFQGARLTAWELAGAGIDVTLICDSAAAGLMAAGRIDLILVGADRVAANGDVVNKVGTLSLAVLANHFGVPFYVACPLSTFDPNAASGREVPIEERAEGEIRQDHAAEVRAFNPAFDVTPARLVTAIITERGIARPPLADSLTRLHGARHGQPIDAGVKP